MIPLSWFLALSAMLFSIGLFAVITRRNSISILMGVELMLNASNINLVAFWRYLHSPGGDMDGLVFALIVFIVAAAEVVVGLGLIVAAYRKRKTVIANELDTMKG